MDWFMSANDPEDKAKGEEKSQHTAMPPFVLNLKLTHMLSDIDQSVSRKYVHHMLIFDFPVVTRSTINDATASIRRGLEVALKRYPFLTGMLGPLENSTRDHVQLRYGETEELRQIRDEIFKVKVHKEDSTLGCYEELCRVGMPTTYLRKEDYCAACSDWKLPEWVPAFALQVNFLEDGALILCLDFQQSVVDETAIGLFLEVFTAGIRGDTDMQSREYDGADLDALFTNEGRGRVRNISVEDFQEWNFRDTALPPHRQHECHILTMSANMVREMEHRINMHVRRYISAHEWVSSTDCICALLWTYIVRAIRLHRSTRGGDQILFTIAVDARETFKDDVNTSQFGNMHTTLAMPILLDQMLPQVDTDGTMFIPHATLKEIADNAHDIHCGLEEVDRNHVLQRLAVLSNLKDLTEAPEFARRACISTLSGIKFGSLAKLGADIDFGIPGTAADGRPRWCRKPWMHDEGMINILPRRGGTQGDADWEILMCLPKDTMKCMLQPDEFGQFIERHVHDNDPEQFVRRRTQFPGRRWIILEDAELRLPF